MSDLGLAASLMATQFSERSGALHFGAVSAAQLLHEFGSPLFVYDAALLRRQVTALRAALPDRVDIYYSVKANPNPEVARVFVDAGTGIEIASAAEYDVARASGCAQERIVFAGPGKGELELLHVLEHGIGEIHVESDEEVSLLTELCARLNRTVAVSIRINPMAAAQGGAMRMGGQPAAFGFDEERLPEVVARVQAAHPALRLSGLHMFAGTQILDADVLVGQWRHAIAIARAMSALTQRPVDTVDLGGGLGIPYFANEHALDLARVKHGAAELFGALEPAFAKTTFIVEPGRFLAGPSGVYLTTVRSVKESRGVRFVVCDGGMNHHLAASGNLGQVIKRDYPIVNASRLSDAGQAHTAVVVGPLCTPLDTVGRKVPLPAATRPGDIIAILQSGAYGLTASPLGFLSHPSPAEVLVDSGDPRVAPRAIRARATARTT